MQRYAVLDGDNVVSNVVIAADPRPEWVASESANIGDRYENGAFVAPVAVPETPVPARVLSRLAFRNRFTPAEKVAIYTAAESSVQIRIFLDDLNTAEEVHLDHGDTAAGLATLEAIGLIGPGRSAEILA